MCEAHYSSNAQDTTVVLCPFICTHLSVQSPQLPKSKVKCYLYGASNIAFRHDDLSQLCSVDTTLQKYLQLTQQNLKDLAKLNSAHLTSLPQIIAFHEPKLTVVLTTCLSSCLMPWKSEPSIARPSNSNCTSWVREQIEANKNLDQPTSSSLLGQSESSVSSELLFFDDDA